MKRGAARWLLALAAGAVIAPPFARAQGAAPHRYAVVVGANKASPGRRDLRYAHNDAQEVADTLIRVAGYAYDDVTVLLDPDPNQVLATLDAVLARRARDEDAILFFYYSGHADAEVLYPNGRPLPLAALRQRLDDPRIGVRVGIIDACRGGGWTGAKGLSPAPPFPVEWPAVMTNRGSVLIASSSGWEDAHESETLRGSFFTHHWNSGLRGAADLNGDGVITANEAFDYAQALTVRDTALVAEVPQHPSFKIDLSGRRDLPLVTLDAAKTTLTLVQSAGPLQLVRLDTGLIVLESPRGRRTLRLSIRPGRYLVRRHVAGDLRATEIELGHDASLTVRESDLASVAPAPLAAKGAGEREVSATILSRGTVETQLALGVRHAPVIDPGLRLGEGGPGAVAILRVAMGLGHGLQLMAPLALGYGGGDRQSWEWVVWGGQPVLGLGRTDAAGTIVTGLVGGGGDARRWVSAHATFNASVSALGSYEWTSQPASVRHGLDTWSVQLSGGVTAFVSDAVSLSVGAAVGHDVFTSGELAPWDRADANAALVLGVGSVQRRGLRTLPLVRIHLSDRLTLDGHVAVAYLPATKAIVETYLAGATALF
ncbi:MAG TPA: caspase family protein [Polyangia bacterium]|nr:caspase family protein [Polyangia bacterium]